MTATPSTGPPESAGTPAADRIADPVSLIRAWLEEARSAGEPMPDAMAVATVTRECVPSVRMVILRGLAGGLVFFTDRESDKGLDLSANPVAAVVLHWLRPRHRQVRVAGRAMPVSDEEADAYWRGRPPGRRIALATSHQSRVIATPGEVASEVEALRRRYPDDSDLPRPDRWGGYRIVADTVEFWEEAADQIHKRTRHRRVGDTWVTEDLAP